MGQLFACSIASSLIILALYLAYKLLLADEKHHNYNRGVLLTIFALSIVIPLLLNLLQQSLSSANTDGIAIGKLTVEDIATQSSAQPNYLSTILLATYLTGAIVALLQTLRSAVRLTLIISRGRHIDINSATLIITDNEAVVPFSWRRYIVVSEADYKAAGKTITLHEMQHIQLNHWLDLLFAQVVCILLWYNPASWLMRRELRNVHEYQADERVLASDKVTIYDYQMLLIKKAVGARFPSLVNSLNHSNLKKRITMMYNQKRSTTRRNLRSLVMVPAIAVALLAINSPAIGSAIDSAADAQLQVPATSQIAATNSQKATASKSTKNNQKTPEKSGNVLPQYPGGESAMIQYLIENINYPESARLSGVEGTVLVQFIVKADGSLTDFQVARSVDPILDAEALRIVKAMPNFIPGTENGKPVDVTFALPISFKVK